MSEPSEPILFVDNIPRAEIAILDSKKRQVESNIQSLQMCARPGSFAACTASIPLNDRALIMKEETGFETLMHAVCVGHGYCGGMHGDRFVHVTDLIPKTGTVTADQFVDMLFIAEYENEQHRISPMSLQHRDTFKKWFVEYMESDAVDASRLRFNT